MSQVPGLHNLNPEFMWGELTALSDIGVKDGIDIGLAQTVIINTLGLEFYEKECSPGGSKQEFFSSKSNVRIAHLAHMLWELKSVAGLPELLKRLNCEEFESAYYELYCAYAFKYAAREVELVIPGGVRGQDFDVRVLGFGDLECLNVEVKARTAVFRDATRVKDFLKSAKGQLPKDASNAIMFKVALGSDGIDQDTLDTAIEKFVKSSGRIEFVFYVWDASEEEDSIALSHMYIGQDGPIPSPFPVKSAIVLNFLQEARAWGASLGNGVAPEEKSG